MEILGEELATIKQEIMALEMVRDKDQEAVKEESKEVTKKRSRVEMKEEAKKESKKETKEETEEEIKDLPISPSKDEVILNLLISFWKRGKAWSEVLAEFNEAGLEDEEIITAMKNLIMDSNIVTLRPLSKEEIDDFN
jgi:hypothetical protein